MAIAERKAVVGGACINTGTIPSKTLREAVLYLSGYRLREIYGMSYSVKQDISMSDLLVRTDYVVRHELDVSRHQLLRNRVELIAAEASFIDANTLRLASTMPEGLLGLLSRMAVVLSSTAFMTESTSGTSVPGSG